MATGPSRQERPLSPHLSIWKWRPNMAVSIVHRVTGQALAFLGLLLFAWWLAAAASGPGAYAVFASLAGHWAGQLVLIGITWAFFQHLLSGLRHLVMDAGFGYAPAWAQRSAALVFLLALVLTVLVWAAVLGRRGLLP